MKKKQLEIIIPLHKKSLLAVVENSVGSTAFQNFYALVEGKECDIANGGKDSCAYFVSATLLIFKFINELHATVSGTVRDMQKRGWEEVSEPTPGDVLVWEAKVDGRGEQHQHIGFFVGGDQAVSNSSTEKKIAKHHFTYGEEAGDPKRSLAKIFSFPNSE